MVDLAVDGNEVVLRVRGLHQLWALKREIRIPCEQLTGVQAGMADEARKTLYRSLRLPGTFLPGVIRAGSYRTRGAWLFWDVVGKGQRAVTLSTKGHRYAQLVVDVADPKAAVQMLSTAIKSKAAG